MAANTPSQVARELSRLIAGEIEVRDFPWLSNYERRALGALGMSMLKAGKFEVAMAAFRVLIDLEPDIAVHHLMSGHSAVLADDVPGAFSHFGRAIALSSQDERNRDVAAEAFLARGDLLLRIGRTVEARADLADALVRLTDPVRRRSIEVFLAS
ncbi:MAG: hypothetical protein H6729_16320 [Deltaproteobacteria bacterium]|nr:hypothetical protein [Deltaproteobacteria bacterium]